jgi:hypothetical protein
VPPVARLTRCREHRSFLRYYSLVTTALTKLPSSLFAGAASLRSRLQSLPECLSQGGREENCSRTLSHVARSARVRPHGRRKSRRILTNSFSGLLKLFGEPVNDNSERSLGYAFWDSVRT